MKKMFSFFLILYLLTATVSAFAEDVSTEYNSGDYKYIILADGTAEITEYTGSEEHIVLPYELNGIKVTSVGDWAIIDCDSVKSITVSDNISSIGNYSFFRCKNLTKIILSDSILVIGDNPFYGCSLLEEISVSQNHPYLATINGVLFSKPDKRLICYPNAAVTSLYTIPQGIVSIGDAAFSGSNNLISITIPDSVTNIGERAFSHCNNLTYMVIPDKVRTLGYEVFGYCVHLESVVLPYGLLSIGDGAFNECESLKSISIPNSVTSIGDGAFAECISLVEITIPNSVSFVGKNPFLLCSNLRAIYIPQSHPYLSLIDGVLFSKPDNRLICYPITLTQKEYQIPTGTNTVGDISFFGCSNLRSVIIPNSVSSIGERSFCLCENLEKVVIPNSVSFIGDNAFIYCNNLTISIPRDPYVKQYCEDNWLTYIYSVTNDW